MTINRQPILYDTNMKRIAYLHNAYDIEYELQKNKLATCSFSMPLNDEKMKLVQPKYFIELWDHHKRVGMFVVNPKNTTKNESTNEKVRRKYNEWNSYRFVYNINWCDFYDSY